MKLKSTGLKFKNLGNPPTTIQTSDNHISLLIQVLAVGSVGRDNVLDHKLIASTERIEMCGPYLLYKLNCFQ